MGIFGLKIETPHIKLRVIYAFSLKTRIAHNNLTLTFSTSYRPSFSVMNSMFVWLFRHTPYFPLSLLLLFFLCFYFTMERHVFLSIWTVLIVINNLFFCSVLLWSPLPSLNHLFDVSLMAFLPTFCLCTHTHMHIDIQTHAYSHTVFLPLCGSCSNGIIGFQLFPSS